jgi:NADH dehydrogenase
MAMKKICILGGGGFVGRHLASQLAAQGHNIVIPSRRRNTIKDLCILPSVEVVEADIHETHELEKLFAGMDAVINLVGILHGSQKDFVRNHVKLPHKAMEACRSTGVRRFLHTSALGADVTSRSFYQHSKGEGERLVLEPSRGHDLDVTVFRPSVIFGPGDNFLNLFAGMLRIAPIVPLAGARARFQPVHVDDVARAFALSLDDPATFGQAYNLCGPMAYSLQQLLELVGRELGRTPRIIPLGPTASYWFARMMELKPGAKLMTRDNYYAMQVDNVCPEGFPTRFGKPIRLENVIGYLREAAPRRAYDDFRARARR